MKRSKFSAEQIVYAIQQAESCAPVGDLCRRCVPAYRDLDVAIPARVALVHDFCCEHRVESEHIPMGDPFLVGMVLNIDSEAPRDNSVLPVLREVVRQAVHAPLR